MTTIAEKLIALNTIKNNIRSAIIAKGGAVPEEDPFADYAGRIGDIPSGGVWQFYSEASDECLGVPDIVSVTALTPDVIYHGNGDGGAFTNIFTNTAKASASNSYGTDTPLKAIDGSTTTYWQTRATLPQWWQYDFGEGNEQRCFGIQIYTTTSSYSALDVEVYASNDGANWTYLDYIRLVNTASWKVFMGVNALTPHRYYRFVVVASVGSYRYLFEIQMSGVPVNKCVDRHLDWGVVSVRPNYFTKTGHTFTGWNTQADGGGIGYAPEDTLNLTAPIKLYAQWAGV